MNLKLIGAVFALFVIVNICAAQDPMAVAPTHYKLAFENDQVQVVNIHYGPHEKSQMHSHPGGVVVYISAGHLKLTDENGKVTEVNAKPGQSRFFPPFHHMVENLSDKPFDAVYVGLKSGAEKK